MLAPELSCLAVTAVPAAAAVAAGLISAVFRHIRIGLPLLLHARWLANSAPRLPAVFPQVYATEKCMQTEGPAHDQREPARPLAPPGRRRLPWAGWLTQQGPQLGIMLRPH